MSIVRWQPLNEVVSLRSAMNKLMEDSFINPSRPLYDFGIEALAPIDMYQNENEIVVKATLPGVKSEDVEITIDGNTLNIRGETKADEEVKQDDYFYQEHRYGAFHRTITLPGGLNTDEAEAAFEDGVLKLTLPKSEAIKPKQIKVKGKTESAAK